MKKLGAGPAPRTERAASTLLHDEPNVRVVAFHLAPGQQVPAHSSDSTVLVQVVEGSGTFDGVDGSEVLKAGESAVYAPGETHAIIAGGGALRFNAFITPRPGS